MLIKFQNAQGLDLDSSVNIGTENSIVLGLSITGDTDPISGKIFKQAIQIGEYSWTVLNGASVVWYTGVDQPIYVNNSDVIKAVTTTPTYPDVTLTIVRSNPDLENIVNLAEFVEAIRPMAPNVIPVSRIRDVIRQIGLSTGIVYSQRTPINVANIKAYVLNNLDLPDQQANIFYDQAALDEALATKVPPTTREIFDNWTRIAQAEYYPKGSTIPSTSEASKWIWDDAQQSAVQPLNSVGFNGFISTEFVENYDLETTVTSKDGDDDWIGIVMAFKREDNTNYSLNAWVCCDSSNNGPGAARPNLSLDFFTNGNRVVFKSNPNNAIKTGWNSKFKRIKVSRRGNQFTVSFTDWDSLVYNPDLTMSIDISTDARLQRFQGPMAYGFSNLSQAFSTFKDIRYSGGLMLGTIIDALNNKVYRYDTVNFKWVLIPGFTAQDIYGSPRKLTNPETGESFQLNTDGTITKLT